MKYMLDTETCCFIIKGVPSAVSKARELEGQWCISTVVYQELMAGLLNVPTKRIETGLQLFLRTARVLEYSMSDALVAAELMVANNKNGHDIGVIDSQVAGHAASAGLTLVSGNSNHFKPMLGVTTESWV
jgi:tRNA(fMet)-specific endonuclease VapC